MRIAVYLTGGIACYKAVNVVRELEKQGNDVKVVMTKNAENFVGSQTLAALTKSPVLDDLWTKNNEDKIAHIQLARWTELAIVVPATANFIAKMANGIADDAASTAILATSAKKLIVPAMNDQMLENPATKRNLKFLEDQKDVHIMEPETGLLAEGYSAKGRMPEPDKIISWVNNIVGMKQNLVGKHVLITAGGTKEAIDPVRYIGNHSSGKMGIALAEAAKLAGAEVTLIYGAISVDLPAGVKTIHAETALKMKEAVEQEFPKNDILIMAAAVGDFRVENISDHKIKKTSDKDTWSLKLVKNPDILKEISSQKRDEQVVIGFAAETDNLLENAKRKLEDKGADIIIANNVYKDTFGSDNNKAYMQYRNGQIVDIPRMAKTTLAQKIISKI